MQLFDTYNLRARVAPMYVVLIPVIVAIAAWAPEALSLKLGSAAAIASVGLSMLIAQFGRNFGKRKEDALWTSWGGAPTTQLLRHRNAKFNPILRSRYHSRLRVLCPDLRIPTPEDEERDPVAADHSYGAATRYLISATRDAKKFPLIFKENVNYGFLRNLWGLKPFGLGAATLAGSACVVRLWLAYRDTQSVPVESVAGILISLVLLLVWLWWVKPSTVRVAAEAYAERLLEACEQV